MPVQEFECQIARGQIGRYLNGEGLSSEGLRHLGVHVAECTECKTFLDHRKATLQGMLGETPMPERQPAQAVVDVNPSEALIAQIRARSHEVEPEPAPVVHKPKPIITKPILYCGGLAIVLVAMTYLSRNPTGFLGPSASQAVASKTTPAAADPKPSTETAKPEAPKPEAAKPAAEAKPVETKPTTPAATDPKTTPAQPTAETTPAKTPDEDDATKPAINPTGAKASSPISIDTAPAKPLVKPHAKPAKKLAARPKAKANRWHRARHTGGLYHMKPGTSAIHVYSN